ncbi:B3 domain-containing transcription factor VRN1-like [Papaver somniferum]|uniref:B3 domain-containing transcription factor VRN1-like n=1 Tax=Papaver somniferum TaxID=3469 RepID=UPI000E6FC8A7|nr:B3 domain-containing transcription factor VRN1-like [Papaver somniferum]
MISTFPNDFHISGTKQLCCYAADQMARRQPEFQELPKEFTDKCGTELSDNAIIKVPNGGIWHIGLRNAEGVILFQSGWPEFMEFYSICVGHVLLFRYDGNSEFQLHIFGIDATEIEYPSHANENANNEVEMTSTHMDEDEVVSIHSGERQEFSQKTAKQRTVIPTRIHTKAFKETLEAAEAFKSDNPSFKLILQALHFKGTVKVPIAFTSLFLRNVTRMMITLSISDGRTWEVGYIMKNRKKINPKIRYHAAQFKAMREAVRKFTSENPFYKRVPLAFATSHFTNITRMVITLMVSDGRTWELRYVSRSPKQKVLSQGWHKFVADNNLKEGDVCVFELVDRKNIKMLVHIFGQQKPSARKPTPKSGKYTAEFYATLDAAEKFTSQNPFFKVAMQAAHIKKGTMTVPAVFATQHLTDITRMVITLKVSDEKTWEVHYVSGTPTEKRISLGWREFVADNGLKEGDVCVFELVDFREKSR